MTASVDPVANLARIKAEIAQALEEAGRAGPVEVVAVSKTHETAAIRPLLEAGHRVFGENRIQEATAKWPALKSDYADIELRLIGPLQSNKAGEAVGLFDVIETVDRPKIAAALAKEIQRQNRAPRLLVQVNTGEEAQKAGVAPEEALAFVEECRRTHGLVIEGLMCIPPLDDPPAPHFALLAKLAAEAGLPVLSMGMSADYSIAALLGASHVRIGSGIFGPRPKP